jgi:hypothetical protein
MPNGDCTDFKIFGDVVVDLGYPIKKLDQFPLIHRRRQPSRPGGLPPVVLLTVHDSVTNRGSGGCGLIELSACIFHDVKDGASENRNGHDG